MFLVFQAVKDQDESFVYNVMCDEVETTVCYVSSLEILPCVLPDPMVLLSVDTVILCSSAEPGAFKSRRKMSG